VCRSDCAAHLPQESEPTTLQASAAAVTAVMTMLTPPPQPRLVPWNILPQSVWLPHLLLQHHSRLVSMHA
jgi:hypothetical protein